MYRVLCRDHVSEAEIRSLWHIETGSAKEADAELAEKVELDPADFHTVGPYLLLIAAVQKAEQIIAEARRESEQIYAAAKSDALAARAEVARDDLEPAATAFANAAQSLIVFEEQLLTASRPSLVRLALQIAEKIVGRTVVEDPNIVRSVLERARGEIVNAREIRIWLNPADHKLLAHVAPQLLESGPASGRSIQILGSEEVSRGGCRLETEIGVIDATIPTQIEEMHRQLLDEDKPSD